MDYQRKFPRIPLSGWAMLKILETNTQISGPIELISRGGIGIYTKEKVKKGDRVSIKLFCDIVGSAHEFTFFGVVRTEEKQKEFGSIGIQFEKEINSIEHPHLYNFLISQEKTVKSV